MLLRYRSDNPNLQLWKQTFLSAAGARTVPRLQLAGGGPPPPT